MYNERDCLIVLLKITLDWLSTGNISKSINQTIPYHSFNGVHRDVSNNSLKNLLFLHTSL